MTKQPKIDTREAIMAAARSTVQKDGYNALSFRDLAADVGIKSASVHHHFPTKPDLADALVKRYREDVTALLEPLADLPFAEAMNSYVALFRSFFSDCNQMCLGGMFSAEVTALPEAVNVSLRLFMDAHTSWIERVLAKKHDRMSADELNARAKAVFAALEGAQLVTRGRGGDPAYFDEIVKSYQAIGLLD